MAYNYEQVMEALRNADKAGDTESARRLAQIAQGLKGKQESSGGFLDNIVGAGEAALSTASGLAAAIPTGIRTLGELAATGNLNEALERSKSTQEAATYTPRTPAGKRMTESVQNTLSDYQNEVANKYAGDVEYLMRQKEARGETLTPEDYAAMNKERMAGEVIGNLYAPGVGNFGAKGARVVKPREAVKPKGPDLEAAMADMATPESTPPADRPPLPDVMQVTPGGQGILSPQDKFFKDLATAQEGIARGAKNGAPEGYEVNPTDPFAQMKQQLGTPQRMVEQNPVMDQMAQNLQGQPQKPPMVQGELDFNQRPQMDLEQQPMDLPPQQPRPPMAGEQGEMFGNPELLDLKREQMQPGVEPSPMRGPQGEMLGQPDLFELKNDAQAPALPPNSLYEAARKEARDKMVENDPRVQQAEQRLTKTQEMYLKAAADVQEGRLNAAHLKRIQRDMDNFQESLDYIKQRVVEEKALEARKARELSSATARGRQSGAVDMRPLKEAVDRAVEKLKAYDFPIVRNAVEKYRASDNPKVFADARREAKESGANTETLAALDNAYMAAVQKTIGQFEGSIRGPIPGKKPGGPGGKQGGWILLDGKKQDALKNLATKLDIETKLKEFAPSQWTVSEAIDNIKKAGDLAQGALGNAINYLTKGGQYLAMKTHNPMIRFVVERFLDADRLARADVRDWIYTKDTGLGALMRDMSKKEQAEAWSLISYADLHQRPIDLNSLANRGFSPEQIKFIEGHQKAMAYAFNMINKARAAAGLDPVTPRTAYAAMQATGDFRSLVYDAKGGNIVGVISSDFKTRLNRLKEQMEGKGFYVEKERYFGGMPRERGSANQAFMHAIEVLADKDPRIAQFVDTLNAIRGTEINNFLNMKRHTMAKKGVFGMEGRKPWEDAQQNALDGLKTQMNYLEASIKWGHLSEAFKDAKEVLSSPDTAHMPNARDWSERYMYNALGFNPSDIGRAVEESIAKAFKEMGVGYSIGRNVIAKSRYLTNSLLLTLNPRFWYTNIVQPLQAMPGMKADLVARGLDAGFDFGTGYMYVAQGANTSVRIRSGGNLDAFDKAAAEYARKRHVYGSDMVEHSNRPRKDAGYYVDQVNNFFSGNIESATRQVMFHAFAHMLHENGMSIKAGLFDAAHNMTDVAMNNYSSLERPQIYNTLGPAGDLAVNLQSYKHNELSRVAMFIRDGMEYKSLRPVMADMLTRFAMGGILGLLAYDEVDSLFHFATKAMGHPMSLSNLVFKASEGANKYIYDKTGGKVDAPYLVSNGIHSMLGVDMSRSLGLTDVVPSNVGEAFFPGGSKLAQTAGAAYEFATNPSEMNAKRTAYAAAPVFAQGAMNNAWFTKGEGDQRVALRPRDLKAQAYRSDFDYAAKAATFTGINESVQRQKTYNVETINRDYADLRQKPLDQIRDSLFAKGNIDPKAVQNYVKYRGNLDTLEGDIMRYAQEQSLTPKELAIMRSQTSSSVGALLKARDYLEMFNK
jgi:hypothetical protein